MAVTVEFTAADAKLLASLRKQLAAQEETIQKYKEQEKASKGADKAAQQQAREAAKAQKELAKERENSFGARALSDLKAMGTNMLSLGAATQLVGQMMAYTAAETQAAVQSMKQMREVNKDLLAIAGSTRDKLSMDTQADQMAVQHGLTRDVSRQLVADARGMGFDAEVAAEATRLFSDPEAIKQLSGKVPGLYGGQVSQQEALDLALMAAGPSALSPSDFAKVIPIAAETSIDAGSSFEETLALLSATSDKFTSAETTANRLKAFGGKVALDDRLRGKGLQAAALSLRDEFSEEERRDFLGENMEVNAAYSKIIGAMDKIDAQEQALIAERKLVGTNKSYYAQRLAIEETDPTARLNRQLAGSEALREMEREERYAAGGAQAQIARNEELARLDEQRTSPLLKFLADQASQQAESAGGGELVVRSVARGVGEVNPYEMIAQSIPGGAAWLNVAKTLQLAGDYLLGGAKASQDALATPRSSADGR